MQKFVASTAVSQVKNIFRKPYRNTYIFRNTTLLDYCLYCLPQMRLLILQIVPFLIVISIILFLEKIFDEENFGRLSDVILVPG